MFKNYYQYPHQHKDIDMSVPPHIHKQSFGFQTYNPQPSAPLAPPTPQALQASPAHQAHQASQALTHKQVQFDTYFNKLLDEYITSSATFIVSFEDNTEGVIFQPQTALVRDLYQEIYNRASEDSTLIHIGIYTDKKCNNYIPNCNESLQSLIIHYNLTPTSPSTNPFPVYQLFISTKPQSKKYSYTNSKSKKPNLTINGKAVPPNFNFGTQTHTTPYYC